MNFVTAALLIVVTAADGAASGQSITPTDAFFMGGMGGWGHASTAEEGMLRGMGDLTRSVGIANLMNSEAAKNWEDSRTKNITNRAYGAETFFQMRDMNRQAREAERGPRPNREQLARLASARVPQRLSVSELDPLTGVINWPASLRDPGYADPAANLNQLFAARAEQGYLSAQQRVAVRASTDELLQLLRQNIQAYSPEDYIQAKRFVEQLGFEMSVASS